MIYDKQGEKYDEKVLPLIDAYLVEKAKGDALRAELAELEAALPEEPVEDETTTSENTTPSKEEILVEAKRKEVQAQEKLEAQASNAAYLCYYNSTYNATAALKEYNKLEKLLADMGAEAIETLKKLLTSSDENTRKHSAFALAITAHFISSSTVILSPSRKNTWLPPIDAA